MNPSRIKKLFQAIEAGNVSTVTAMLDEEPGAVDVYGDGNRLYRDKTPLMYALQCNHFCLARTLVRRGANVGARMAGGPGSSVISLAVRFVISGRSNREMVQLVSELIDAGADPSDALWAACHAYDKATDQPEMIELLLQRGADPETLVGNTGSTVRKLVEVNASHFSPHVLALFGLESTP